MRYVLTISLTLTTLLCMAQGGINFHTSSWEEAVTLAQAQDKLIFIDGYTTWCAPCKTMEEFVFTQPSVGEYYNTAFINLHLDMEKGVGPLIGVQHGVRTYPAMLYVTWDGTLVSSYEGYQDVDALISHGRSANQPDRISTSLDRRYAEGDRKPDLLYHLTYDRIRRDRADHRDLVPQYLEAQRDWLKPQAMEYIFRFVEEVDSDMFKHMAAHPYEYAETIGDEAYSDKFNDIVKTALNPEGRTISLEERETIYRIAYPGSVDRMMIDYRMKHFADLGDDAQYSSAAYDYYTDYGADDVDGLKRDLPILERHLGNSTQQAQITTWYREMAREGSSAQLFALGERYMRTGAYEEAKQLKSALKSAIKAEGGSKKALKQYLKSIKTAERA